MVEKGWIAQSSFLTNIEHPKWNISFPFLDPAFLEHISKDEDSNSGQLLRQLQRHPIFVNDSATFKYFQLSVLGHRHSCVPWDILLKQQKMKRNCIFDFDLIKALPSGGFSGLGPKGRGKLGWLLRLVLAPFWLLCWAYGSPSTATKSLLCWLSLGDDLWFVHMPTGWWGSITRMIS